MGAGLGGGPWGQALEAGLGCGPWRRATALRSRFTLRHLSVVCWAPPGEAWWGGSGGVQHREPVRGVGSLFEESDLGAALAQEVEQVGW